MPTAEAFFLLMTTAAAAYYLAVALAALRFRGERAAEAPWEFVPPVSILKPLHGTPPGLYECLASVCRQDYPQFEVLCCVANPGDPALGVVRRLQLEFPGLAIREMLAGPPLGSNAKVTSLDSMYRAARHEVLVIADDDILAKPDYLRRVVGALASADGVVTCPYRGIPGESAASRLEALGLAAEFFPGVLMARATEGIRFAMGSTIAFRKSLVDEIGGLAAIADYLADDYEIGARAAAIGRRNLLSTCVVDTRLPDAGWREVVAHQLRWMQAQRASRPASHVALVVTYGAPFAIAGLVASGGSSLAWSLAAAWLAARIAGGYCAGAVALDDPVTRRWWFLIPVRELLSFMVWAASLFSRSVVWRGDRFSLVRGKLVPAPNRKKERG